jgi:large subunit ribosomal protein L24
MSRIKTHVKKGDFVEVISGNHKGKVGEVVRVHPSRGQVILDGVRMIKKHVRPSQSNPEGGIIEIDGPIHISNVKLVEKVEE